jgi:hypothetical protein
MFAKDIGWIVITDHPIEANDLGSNGFSDTMKA